MRHIAKELRAKLREGLKDIGCNSEEDILQMASSSWKSGECSVGWRVFAGLILLLFGRHAVFPELIGLIRSHWDDVIEPPSRHFLSVIPTVFPLPVSLQPPVESDERVKWYLGAPLLDWYEMHQERLTWSSETGVFELSH